LLKLRKGDRAKVTCPAYLAYGSRARGSIPANSTLMFDIEVLDIGNSYDYDHTPEPWHEPTTSYYDTPVEHYFDTPIDSYYEKPIEHYC